MREQEIERRIRTAVEHAAPDPLDRILSACGPQCAAAPLPSPRSRRRWVPLAAAAALALLLCGGFGIRGALQANTVDSVVMLDVNPSISLSVNARERVLDVTPLNSDAAVILGDMDLTGTQLNVAVNALIGSMLQNGYLSDLQNAILVSVENRDAAKSARLQRELTNTINTVLQGGALEGAVLSQAVAEDADLAALAEQYGISQGKAALIQEVAAQDPTLTFASLAPLTVNEIALIAESRRLSTQSVTTTGSASDKAYIGTEAAKDAALRHAGVQESAARRWRVELDSEDGVMVYEVEFQTGSAEYEYDVDARTGAVVKASAEGREPTPESSGESAASDGAILKAEREAGEQPSSGALIGEEAALGAALRHAGVAASDVSQLQCELDEDDGIARYEVEFQTGGTEYEYEIDAATGAILKADWETDD